MAMNITEAVNAVVETIKRPDLRARSLREINAAINQITTDTDFMYDLIESTIDIDVTLYAQNIDTTTLTRFRKFFYIRPVGRNKYLSHTLPTKIFNKGCEALDTYYVSGINAILKTRDLNSQLYIGYFSYAPTLDEVTNTSHWILDRSPYLIIDRACAKLFLHIGDDSSSARHDADFKLGLLSIIRDYKYGVRA